jgi:hypothetical protein
MKKLFIYSTSFIVMLLLSFPVFAQSNKEDVDMIQSAFGKEKKDIVKEYMQVDAQKSDAFWKLYDEYEDKRKAIGRERISLIQQYADSWDSLDDKKAQQLASATLANDAKYTSLYQAYLTKFSSVVGAKNAAKLFQLETYLQTMTKLWVMDQIPFIGELDKTNTMKKEQ